jgi:hypothetical protein
MEVNEDKPMVLTPRKIRYADFAGAPAIHRAGRGINPALGLLFFPYLNIIRVWKS